MADHHGHGHGHGHGHSHGSGNEKALAIAALLTGGFMVAEVFGGIVSGSLALIADAGHMLTDFASLSLAWFALRLARRPASWKRTYGFDRFSILAAFVNGLSLFLIAAWICYEAYQRMLQPVEVIGSLMLWIALAGLLVNILAFWVLTRGEKENLNIRAATLHVVGDLLGSVAALIASIVIIYTGWVLIDPILSVLVALIILRSAWYVVRQSAHILLEGAPEGFDRRDVSKTLEQEVDGLLKVHHIHAWSITQERPMATLEAAITKDADAKLVKDKIKKILHNRFGIEHSTVELSRR
ncbi:MAG: cobalt-zinc-cadmium efflux system protein [Arenicella sp.]